jgi:AraC family transcriptional regulator of adaptative response/methylated-DNA-[protein]-cysteine methyltransferase
MPAIEMPLQESTPQCQSRPLPPREEMVRAMLAGDGTFDGVFITAVRTTGIFCLPSCRPPRRPKPENVEFFGTIREALFAGYRPCKLCRSLELEGQNPAWVEQLLARIEQAPQARIQAHDLRGWGLSPERVRRWFQQHYGMTFAEWCRGRRLSEAFTRIREGAELDDVALGHGYASHSGFREAFGQTFGQPPGRSQGTECVVTGMIDSPVGKMLAAATEDGICLLEYTDRRMLERNLETMRRRFSLPVVPGEHKWLKLLGSELSQYFDGRLKEFTVPVSPRGTPFQERVWQELRRIPHGSTISYQELASRIEQPTAVRAVANANGQACGANGCCSTWNSVRPADGFELALSGCQPLDCSVRCRPRKTSRAN